ncbi:MAG: bile acid:sodium symporter [Acidimicrobiia bacterium]|nr:bile acid:sodium symporter [Acidimicrobiia bacterium]
MDQLFNAVIAVFIVLTMLTAGFTTTFDQVRSVIRRPALIGLVLLIGIVIRPLIGWGAAEMFGLASAAYVAMVITASAPGAPFGAKLVMTAKADVSSGAVLQVLLAVVMSFTFAPVANGLISAAELGSDLTLPVRDILLTVVVLQLAPFVVGILMRHWTEDVALEWNEFSSKGSSVLFLVVLAGALLGSWQTIIDLLGDLVLLGGAVAAVIMIVLGYFVSTGNAETRKATSLIQPMSNSGPAFAAVAIAFDGDPAILGAVTGILLIQLVAGVVVAGYFGKEPSAADKASA